jgi:hypothetical protein
VCNAHKEAVNYYNFGKIVDEVVTQEEYESLRILEQ